MHEVVVCCTLYVVTVLNATKPSTVVVSARGLLYYAMSQRNGRYLIPIGVTGYHLRSGIRKPSIYLHAEIEDSDAKTELFALVAPPPS